MSPVYCIRFVSNKPSDEVPLGNMNWIMVDFPRPSLMKLWGILAHDTDPNLDDST